MSKVIHVTDQSFEREVIESDVPVLVDFWAPWCGPCRMLGPIVDELAADYAGRIKVAKLNTQENSQVPMTLGVRSIPAVVLFDGPEVVNAMIGARPKVAFVKMLDKYLKKSEKKQAKEEKRRQKEAERTASL